MTRIDSVSKNRALGEGNLSTRFNLSREARTAWLTLSLLAVPGLARADPRLDARRHFRAGMRALAHSRYEEGIAELRAAYAIKPHPSVLYNIAQAYLDQGKVAEAIASFQQYLTFDPPDAAPVGAKLTQLQASVAARPAPPASSAPEIEMPSAEPEPEAAPAGLSPASQAKLERLINRLDAIVARTEALEQDQAEAARAPPTPAAAPVERGEIQDELGEDRSDAYEEMIVTASRRAQSALMAPAATTAIDEEEIHLSGATTLPELLRRVPGMDVMELGVGSADVSSRGFNQRVSNKVLVLVDGRSVYEDFLGFTLFDELPIEPEEIERIEIIRGPGSALYGANAFLGVVNIITKRPGTGPAAQLVTGGGSGATGEIRAIASQRQGRFAYRASAGYAQADKWSADYAPDRTDITSQVKDPALGLRSARAHGAVSYALARGAQLDASAGVNKLYTEIYPPGLLRNDVLDGVHLYGQTGAAAGPFKVRAFWNHLEADAGPQYWPVGERSIATSIVTHVLDGEAQLDQPFRAGGQHHLALGVGYRLKAARWNYLDRSPVEHHFSAFAQEEYRPVSPLALSVSLRADRHPLLDHGGPGFAVSPRCSAVYAPFEGHAVRFSAGTAFREPTLVESYLALETPVPGQPGVAVLTRGNSALRPERLFALELGYRGELPGLQWDLALYRNQVRDLVVLSPVEPLPAAQRFDPQTHAFLLGASQFENDPPVYSALGAELGIEASPADRLALRGAVATERIAADAAQCGPCTETPGLKLSASASYRTPYRVDLGAEAAYVSSTMWIEREPDPSDPTRVALVGNPLGAYAVVHARAAYRFLDDHLELAVVGANLATAHQEHPFGNRIDARVLATLGAQL